MGFEDVWFRGWKHVLGRLEIRILGVGGVVIHSFSSIGCS